MNRIKVRRNEKGFTQAELAKILGIAQNTLSYWEAGKSSPDSESLIKLAEALETSIDFLLGRDDTGFMLDDEAIECLNELHKNKEMETLFQLSKKATKEDLKTAIIILETLIKKGNES